MLYVTETACKWVSCWSLCTGALLSDLSGVFERLLLLLLNTTLTPPLLLLPLGALPLVSRRSALSLAGFCALVRHLPRLTDGLLEALAAGATSKQVGHIIPWHLHLLCSW